MAGGKLLGIKDKDNQYKYVIDSYTKAKAMPEIIDDEEIDDPEDIEENE
jgi:hypothetical protein